MDDGLITDTFDEDTIAQFQGTPLWKPWMRTIRLRQARSLEDVETFLRRATVYPEICWDIETKSLNPDPREIVGHSVAFDGREAMYVPVRHQCHPEMNLDPDEVLRMVLSAATPPKILSTYNHHFEGCAVGETKVVTSDGIARLRDLVGEARGRRILTEYGLRPYQQVVSNGVKEIFEIKTRYGRLLRLTGNHQLRVFGPTGRLEWRRVDSLRIGDHLLCQLGSKGAIPQDRGRPTDFWYTIGLLYGDGSRSWQNPHQYIWHVPEGEEETREFLLSYLGSVGYNPGTRISKSEGVIYKTQTGSTITTTQSMEAVYCNCLHYYDILPPFEPEGAWKAKVPELLLRSGEAQIAAFISGLFTTDGGVYVSTVCNEQSLLRFGTRFLALAQEVQYLLGMLGITSSVYSNLNKETHLGTTDEHVVCVSGRESWKRFQEKVGFGLKRKTALLDEEVASRHLVGGKPRTVWREDRGYPNVGNLLWQVFPSKVYFGYTKDKRCEAVTIYKLRNNPNSCLSKAMFDRIVSLGETYGSDPGSLAALKQFRDEEWFSDAVHAVTSRGEQEVFDVVGSVTSSYVSDWAVSHNSFLRAAGIERSTSFDVLHDVMLLVWLYNSDEKRINLKDTAKKMLGHEMLHIREPSGVARDRRKTGVIDFSHGDPRECTLYAAADVVMTMLIEERVLPSIETSGQKMICELEHLLIQAMLRMYDHSVRIDRAVLQAGQSDLLRWCDVVATELYLANGVEGAAEAFNIASAAETAAFLRRQQVPLFLTPTGKDSTDAKSMATLSTQFPIVRRVSLWRSLMKEIGTYCVPLLDHTSADRPGGLFRMVQHGAATGRMSARKGDAGDPRFLPLNAQSIPAASAYVQAACRRVANPPTDEMNRVLYYGGDLTYQRKEDRAKEPPLPPVMRTVASWLDLLEAEESDE